MDLEPINLSKTLTISVNNCSIGIMTLERTSGTVNMPQISSWWDGVCSVSNILNNAIFQVETEPVNISITTGRDSEAGTITISYNIQATGTMTPCDSSCKPHQMPLSKVKDAGNFSQSYTQNTVWHGEAHSYLYTGDIHKVETGFDVNTYVDGRSLQI